MNRKLLTLTIAGALALGGGAFLQAKGPGEEGEGPHKHGHRMMHMGFGLKHLAKELDLTAQQQAQVGPIIDEMKPQMRAIHQEAMEKSRVLMEATMAKIRPLLTPEQQAKCDKLKKAHEKVREAMKAMHEARAED